MIEHYGKHTVVTMGYGDVSISTDVHNHALDTQFPCINFHKCTPTGIGEESKNLQKEDNTVRLAFADTKSIDVLIDKLNELKEDLNG